ncbi:MAG: hypothetical protein ACYDD4_08280 [Acidimicrobiales bacterium]
MTLPWPWLHNDVSALGNVAHRQAKVPGWSRAICAAGTGDGLWGVNMRGRYPSSASSCWVRSSDMGATAKVVVLSAAIGAPVLLTTPWGPPGTVRTSATPGENPSVAVNSSR